MARLAAAITLPRILEAGLDETPTLAIYLGKEIARPSVSGSTYTLRDDTGAVVTSGPVTVSSDGVASFSVAGTLTEGRAYSDAWLEEWALMIGGKLHRFRCDALLVYRRLQNVCTHGSLLALHPQLEADLLGPEEPDFSKAIDEAFEQFERDLLAKGNRINAIVTPWACLESVRALALSILFRDAITNANGETDRFRDLSASYAKQYEKCYPRIVYRSDPNDDSTVADVQQAVDPVVFLSATPRRSANGLADG